jgi:hypothetical protein
MEHPIDVSLMFKEIIQCENIIDRMDKILVSINDDKQISVAINDSRNSSLGVGKQVVCQYLIHSSEKIHRNFS